MKNFFKLLLIILAIILTVIGLVFFTVSRESKSLYIEFGDDKIPTITNLLGEEKKVSSVSTGLKNGINYKTLSYNMKDITIDDLNRYIELLMDQDKFLLMKNEADEIAIVKESSEEGKIITIDFERGEKVSSIKYTKEDGTLKVY